MNICTHAAWFYGDRPATPRASRFWALATMLYVNQPSPVRNISGRALARSRVRYNPSSIGVLQRAEKPGDARFFLLVQDVVIEDMRHRPLHAVHDELGEALAPDEAVLDPRAHVALDIAPAAPFDGRRPHGVGHPRQCAPVPFPAHLMLTPEEPGLFTAVSALHRQEDRSPI